VAEQHWPAAATRSDGASTRAISDWISARSAVGWLLAGWLTGCNRRVAYSHSNELIAKLDDLRHEAGKIDARITAHLASIEGSLNELKHRPIISDNPDHRGKTINGNVITSEVTVFHTVPHDNGSIYTGWRYPDGASADQPPIGQYCYWESAPLGGASSGASVRINLANNGVRLPNIADGVPLLEDALKRCVWWNGSTN
jgi:hypothetical protein